MLRSNRTWWTRGIALALWMTSVAAPAAQVTPAPAAAPDDTPSVRVGGTLFADFTQTREPTIVDAGGNTVSPSAFNVSRAYLNVTGQLNHLFGFRITPDIARETGSGSSLAGSQDYRLKYGYVQMNLDDWLWRGTFARAGLIQTPYVDFEETVYRYRFQGSTFLDREGYVTSSDYGVSMRTLVPRGYGEVVGGLYNGEGFTRADPNNQKALAIRGTLRPFPSAAIARGLRVTAFYSGDHTVQDADRRRAVTFLTFEHPVVNAGWSTAALVDQASPAAPRVEGRGQSLWITPRVRVGGIAATPAGQTQATVEGLFRYDRLRPDRATAALKQRWITGVAYWPRMRAASVTAAFLLDYEHVTYTEFHPARVNERRLAAHLQVGFCGAGGSNRTRPTRDTVPAGPIGPALRTRARGVAGPIGPALRTRACDAAGPRGPALRVITTLRRRGCGRRRRRGRARRRSRRALRSRRPAPLR
jgi:hypothetical protein